MTGSGMLLWLRYGMSNYVDMVITFMKREPVSSKNSCHTLRNTTIGLSAAKNQAVSVTNVMIVR